MKKLLKYAIPIVAGLFVAGIVWSANLFPSGLNIWQYGEPIEESWANSLEAKIGINSSAVVTSLDYLIKNSSSTLYRISKTDGGFVVGDGTEWVLESGTTALTSLGLPTNTMALQASTSVYITGGSITGGTITGITDLTVSDGGTGVSTLTDGGILLGNGTGAIQAMSALASGSLVVGDGTTDPSELTIGTDNYLLTASSTASLGVAWQALTINDLGDVVFTSGTYGDVLYWNGTAWANTATSTLGLVGKKDIDTYAELNAIVADVTLTHNGLIDTSAEILAIVTDETGSGSLVFSTNPIFSTSMAIPQGAPTVDAAGEIAIDTTSDQLIYYGGAKRVVVYEEEKSITLTTTTLANMGGFSTTGTSTVAIGAPKRAETISNIYCYTDAGTITIRIGDNTSWSEQMECSSAGVADDGSITNATYTAREKRFIQAGSKNGAVNYVSIEVTVTVNAD